ncbi:ww domain-containing oxidoreductase [Colletotrichum truncatum]|uniref:Ww domain-containing oxidoreductase n=1 Tax=Colletotrichum truncatum TaxID=5467 RepID=A0ACC3YRE1_COLTU|nr:ww domain-containing oxidoreductase [Colletotrichum truncatum]KAF6799176.1 ww domain-containing oxidoreductase [Colletotrichum truncatum]
MTILAPYAKDHEKPNGPGDARPTALKVIRDQNLDDALSGRVYLVTGCTSGIGVETVRALRAAGADVYFTGRNKETGQKLVEKFLQDGRPGKIAFIEIHLDSLASTLDGVKAFKRLSSTLNGLICNAGVAHYPKDVTKDGFETHFGVNHLAHFALFQGLKDLLLKSASIDYPSRVVMVSSIAHLSMELDLEDYNLEKSTYDAGKAYGASKTANIWMANEIERLYGSQNLHANSVHPGAIHTMGIRYIGEAGIRMLESPKVAPVVKSPEQGAATTVWAAIARELQGRGGLYLSDVQEGIPIQNSKASSITFAPHAFNRKSEERLWKLSTELLQHHQEGSGQKA